MRNAIAAVLLVASPAFAQNAALQEGTIACSSPVSPNDSAKSLMLRYGGEAVIQDGLYTGVEDITYKGLVLFPHAPDWRRYKRSTGSLFSSTDSIRTSAASSRTGRAGRSAGPYRVAAE